ncbi:MAG: superinfection immunity protein [Blastocatellia bacterium]
MKVILLALTGWLAEFVPKPQATPPISADSAAGIGFGLILVLILSSLVIYFLPAVIAILRGKQNWFAISALNFFLGWTAIGWIVALVWSLTHDARPQPQVVYYQTPPPNHR